ncbi:hypothetical protein, partial [Thiolapillus sp.]
ELKNSRGSIGDGIRQSLVNQRAEFIGAFVSTVQFIFAGNDQACLRPRDRFWDIPVPKIYHEVEDTLG